MVCCCLKNYKYKEGFYCKCGDNMRMYFILLMFNIKWKKRLKRLVYVYMCMKLMFFLLMVILLLKVYLWVFRVK